MKFIQRPEERETVEAIKYDGNWAPIMAFLNEIGYRLPIFQEPAIYYPPDSNDLLVNTRAKKEVCNVGDWITYNKDYEEFWVLEDGIFKIMYEPLEEE